MYSRLVNHISWLKKWNKKGCDITGSRFTDHNIYVSESELHHPKCYSGYMKIKVQHPSDLKAAIDEFPILEDCDLEVYEIDETK